MLKDAPLLFEYVGCFYLRCDMAYIGLVLGMVAELCAPASIERY